MNRRSLLQGSAAVASALILEGSARAETLPPVRALTRGPKFHWFGYYDKWQFDRTDRYVLSNQASFEHRSPTPDDAIDVGMIDLKDGDRWTTLGQSRAWCWQQGCMLQWLPGARSEVMWNDRQDGRFVCHVLDVKTRRQRTLPSPVYNVSPDGRWGIAPDFRRLADTRPVYGYAGVPDPNRDVLAPQDAGIWRTDMRTGQTKLVIALGDVAKIPHEHGDLAQAKHWFNHLLFSPDGSRFIFLHRWRGTREGKGFSTRMFTADADGKNLYVLDPHGKTSHFIWRDNRTVLAWSWHPSAGDKFFLYTDKTQKVDVVGDGVMTENGHCTYLTGNRWILNDTYPDKQRLQHPYLFEVATRKRVALGHFLSADEYKGEWRCDTHPRSSRDGTKVVIDSPHAGNGRQLYLIDVRDIVKPRA